jgi:hypothetical protein
MKTFFNSQTTHGSRLQIVSLPHTCTWATLLQNFAPGNMWSDGNNRKIGHRVIEEESKNVSICTQKRLKVCMIQLFCDDSLHITQIPNAEAQIANLKAGYSMGLWWVGLIRIRETGRTQYACGVGHEAKAQWCCSHWEEAKAKTC